MIEQTMQTQIDNDKEERLAEKKVPKLRLNAWHWVGITIVSLIVVQLFFTLAGRSHAPSPEMQAAEKQRVFLLIQGYGAGILRDHLPTTEISINTSVDAAFAPAYTQIDALVEAHYSVVGEYAELYAYSKGDTAGFIQSILFAGMDARLYQARKAIQKASVKELSEKLQLSDHELESLSTEDRTLLIKAFNLAKQDSLSRFKVAGLSSKATGAIAGGAVGLLVAKTIATAMSKKLVATIAVKLAAKMAMKTVGTATLAAEGAGAGAAVGSVVPVVGTAAGAAIGGIGGTLIGWFGIDKLFVEADKYINKDEFKKAVVNLIDEQKELYKSRLRQAIQSNLIQLKGKSPAELMSKKH